MVWSMCRRAWKYGLERRVCRIGRKEQVAVNGGWLRYCDLLNSAALFLPTGSRLSCHMMNPVYQSNFCMNSSLQFPSLLAQFHSPLPDIPSPFRWKLEVRNDFRGGHYGWNSPLLSQAGIAGLGWNDNDSPRAVRGAGARRWEGTLEPSKSHASFVISGLEDRFSHLSQQKSP
jgi:hypothetical protein